MPDRREPRPDNEGLYGYLARVQRPNETLEYVHHTKLLLHEDEALTELDLTVFEVARHPRPPELGLVHARPLQSG